MTIKNPIIKLFLLILFVFLVSLFITFVMKSKIETKAKYIFEKRSLLTIMEKSSENFLLLKSSHGIVEEKLPILKNALPNEKNIEKLVVALENLALQTNNGQVLNFEPLDNSEPAGEKIKSLKFSASLKGNIGSFSDYLEKLNKLPYFIEIENISIKNSSNISNNESQMDIKAKVYFGS